MLLILARWLAQDIHGFNVFNYITLRAVLAALTALAISFLVGPSLIRKLTHYKVGQAVRDDGPKTHLIKAGTPTMGGALILVAIAIATLLWGDLSNRYIWVVLLSTLGFGLIGMVDDWRKVVHRNPKGLAAKEKYFWQSVVGVGVAIFLVMNASTPAETTLYVPFFKHLVFPMSALAFAVLTYLVVVGSSNAVNLTDGLDGLAIMPTVLISGALAIFAYAAGHLVFSKYLGDSLYRWSRGVGGILCSDGRGRFRLFMVQRLPRRSIYGRCRSASAGGCVGRRGRHRETRNCAVYYERRVCSRNIISRDSSDLFPIYQK